MTTEELVRIRKRVEAATCGPFHWVSIGRGTCDSLYILMDGREATRDDQYLFAHAQTDLAALLAEVDQLRAERDAVIDLAHEWLTYASVEEALARVRKPAVAR